MVFSILRTMVVLSLLLVLSSDAFIGVSSSHSAICPAISPVVSILSFGELSLVSDFVQPGRISIAGVPVGIVEVDEVSLQRALNVLHMNGKEYVSFLFYANWCPFSKTLRSTFNVLSSLFPTIHHFAIEESFVGPRILSRYVVRGFPTLFLLNSTIRVRYHGPRTLDSLFSFYYDVTGIKPSSHHRMIFERIRDQINLSEVMDSERECPFSWARSPEKLLRQETYLALAVAFVLLRLLYFLLPTFRICIEQAWRRWMCNMNLRLWEHQRSCLQQTMQVIGRMRPCKRSNLQEGAMNARVWASKSLATVSISEASSSKAF